MEHLREIAPSETVVALEALLLKHDNDVESAANELVNNISAVQNGACNICNVSHMVTKAISFFSSICGEGPFTRRAPELGHLQG